MATTSAERSARYYTRHRLAMLLYHSLLQYAKRDEKGISTRRRVFGETPEERAARTNRYKREWRHRNKGHPSMNVPYANKSAKEKKAIVVRTRSWMARHPDAVLRTRARLGLRVIRRVKDKSGKRITLYQPATFVEKLEALHPGIVDVKVAVLKIRRIARNGRPRIAKSLPTK